MKNNLKNIDQIDSWINGSISENERIDFEKRMSEDTEFKKEVQAIIDLTNGIELYGESQIKDSLHVVEKKLENEQFFTHKSKEIKMNTNQKKPMGRLLGIAATALLLLTAGYFFLQNNSDLSTDPNKAFAKYFKPENKSLNNIMDNLEASGFGNPDKEKDDLLAAALKHYEDHEFEKARVSLVSYLDSYPDSKIAKFYLGVSLMQQSEYAKASKHLKPLTQDSSFANYNAAKWYLGLCYSMFNTEQGLKDTEKLMRGLAGDANSGYTSGAKGYMDMMGWI